MKKNGPRLYQYASEIKHEERISKLAKDLYSEIMSKCEKAAGYGLYEVDVHLNQFKTTEFIDKDCKKKVLSIVSVLLKDLKITNDWKISWIECNNTIPTITARELVDMGYNPAEGDLFARILNGIKVAMIHGSVTNSTIQSQKVWVKNNFPIK